MVEQLKVYEAPILALEIIDGFTQNDFELVQKWVEIKREKGFSKMNILLKLDEMKMAESSRKALWDQFAKLMKHFKQIGRISYVGESEILKALVPVDNLFFKMFSPGSEERYFDLADIDQAFEFVESGIQEE